MYAERSFKGMDYLGILKKAFGAGILSTLIYHGALLVMGQPVTIKSVIVFFAVFTILYSLWLFLAAMGKRK
ncbi:MAG: hypothetical protein PHU31_11160 [Anaerotignum sp.]|nr:hypothetical protein [Anaerotignum sp.]